MASRFRSAETMWKNCLKIIVAFICIENSLAMEPEDLCNIVIQPGEYIRMKIDSKLNLSCDLSRNEIDPYNIIPKGLLFLENNRKIDELYNKLEKTVVTTLTNLQVRKNNTYTCRISKPSKFMEMKELIVGDEPSPVQNFACLLYDYEYWNCTFQANERVPTTYKVQYRISRLLYDCPCIEVNRGYECKTQLFRKTHPNYTFVVKSKNCFGEREEWFTIQASKNVIPADLELKVERANSTETQLYWNIITMNEMLFEKGLPESGRSFQPTNTFTTKYVAKDFTNSELGQKMTKDCPQKQVRL